MSEAAMQEIIRVAVEKLGGVRAAARHWDVSASYISDTLNGRRSPGPAIVGQLGYERVVLVEYRKRPE